MLAPLREYISQSAEHKASAQEMIPVWKYFGDLAARNESYDGTRGFETGRELINEYANAFWAVNIAINENAPEGVRGALAFGRLRSLDAIAGPYLLLKAYDAAQMQGDAESEERCNQAFIRLFLEAASNGDEKQVDYLLSSGMSPDTMDEMGSLWSSLRRQWRQTANHRVIA
jgi:hypothetical protein